MAPVQYDDTEFHQKLCRKLNCHLPSLNPIHCYDFPSEPENVYQERHEEGESYSFHPSINLIPSPSFSCFYRSDEANKMIKIKRDRKRITTFSIDKPNSKPKFFLLFTLCPSKQDNWDVFIHSGCSAVVAGRLSDRKKENASALFWFNY